MRPAAPKMGIVIVSAPYLQVGKAASQGSSAADKAKGAVKNITGKHVQQCMAALHPKADIQEADSVSVVSLKTDSQNKFQRVGCAV